MYDLQQVFAVRLIAVHPAGALKLCERSADRLGGHVLVGEDRRTYQDRIVEQATLIVGAFGP
jgi:hypothetical protein